MALMVLLASTLFLWLPQAAILVHLPNKHCYLPAELRLQWRHSVEHQLWREYYRSDGEGLWLWKSEMQTFGAGMAADAEPIAAEQGFVAQKVQRRLPSVDWVVSRVMEGEIHLPQGKAYQRWQLYRVVPNYTIIHFEPAFERRLFLWQERCNDFN